YLQDLVPSRALAARRQAIGPEGVQLQGLPQLPRQPTGAPLPRPTESHVRQAKLNDRLIRRGGDTAILGEQRHFQRASGVRIENLNGSAPLRSLSRGFALLIAASSRIDRVGDRDGLRRTVPCHVAW